VLVLTVFMVFDSAGVRFARDRHVAGRAPAQRAGPVEPQELAEPASGRQHPSASRVGRIWASLLVSAAAATACVCY
jgi:hypothetical protein